MKERSKLSFSAIIFIVCLVLSNLLFYPVQAWAVDGKQPENKDYIAENYLPEENEKTETTPAPDKPNTWVEDIFQVKVNLVRDGKPTSTTYPLFINLDSRAMIAAEDAALLFNFVLDKTDNNQIWLTNAETIISFRAYDKYALKNNETIELSTSPIIINDAFYIPLRLVAEIAGYTINYNAEAKTLYLMSTSFAQDQQIIIPEDLPLWGTFEEVPVLYALYPEHKIIGGYYTTMLSNLSSRTNNIKLTCQKIDGKILNPEQIFSFNQTVGKRTAEAGFKEAPVFAGKKVIPGIGGGICQVSSTLYNTVLSCNLKVIERHPHSMKVAYVPDKRDAAVSFGIQDFKFRNTLSRPIKILAQVLDKYVITAIAEIE